MYIFKEVNQKYPLHIMNHLLLAGGFILAVGMIGVALDYDPMVVFIALLCSLVAGILAMTFLVQLDYEGDLKAKHIVLILFCACLGILLVLWAYWGAVHPRNRSGFKAVVLPLLLANMLLTHLPFLLAHVLRLGRSGRR